MHALHWWECRCVWGRNALSEWWGAFRLRTFIFGLPYVRQRGIEEAAIHTDCGSPKGASRVPPELSVELPEPAHFLYPSLTFHTRRNTHLFRSRNTLGTLTRPVVQTLIQPTTHQCTPVGASAPGEMPLTHQSLEYPNTSLVIVPSMHLELHQSIPPFGIALFLAVVRNIYKM